MNYNIYDEYYNIYDEYYNMICKEIWCWYYISLHRR